MKKIIGFAYATSDIATDLGHGENGCWYLSVVEHEADFVDNGIVYGSESKQKIMSVAEQYDCQWGKWSMHGDEYK